MSELRQRLMVIHDRFIELSQRNCGCSAEWLLTDLVGEPTIGWEVRADHPLTRDELRMTCLEAFREVVDIPGVANAAHLEKHQALGELGLWCEIVRAFESSSYRTTQATANLLCGSIQYLPRYSALAIRRVMLNYLPAPSESLTEDSEARLMAKAMFKAMWVHLVRTKEVKEVESLFKKHGGMQEVERFYERFPTTLKGALAPVIGELATFGVQVDVDRMIKDYIGESKERIRVVLESRTLPAEDAIRDELETWPARPLKLNLDSATCEPQNNT